MKVVLMQPYFFPYLGYYTLMKHADRFVVFDTAQYIRRGWIHRNRILGSNGEPSYINASVVKAPRDTPIYEMKMHTASDWKETIMKGLQVYQKTAPYFEEVRELVRDCLAFPTDDLTDFNVNVLKQTANYLGMETHITKLSDLDIEFRDVQEPDDWGLQLSKSLHAATYVNAPGGQAIYSREKYARHGVELNFYQTNLHPYDQKQEQFQTGLSIIDVMMFNSKAEINHMIDDFQKI